jgi:pyruvate kinase
MVTDLSFVMQMHSEATTQHTSQAVHANSRRKTKIVCTIGPSTNTREMIWKLAETGMNVARLNMSHGDHQSHQKVIDLVKEYNVQNTEGNVIAIMLDTKVYNDRMQ